MIKRKTFVFGLAVLFGAGASIAAPLPQLFVTADQCMACHNGLVTPTGQDISIGVDWRPSMMANAARDPYWHAAVRREVTDHPSAQVAIEDKCSTCHMPMARFQARLQGGHGEVFANLPVAGAAPLVADGTSCSLCHQIGEEGLGDPESFTGGFSVDTEKALGERAVFGPFEVDEGRRRLMQSASGFDPHLASHVQSSELCATCHTLFTHSLGPDGEEVGELPEQVPYLEWQHSAYPGEEQSCSSCHMPVVEGEVAVSSVVGIPRTGVSRHVFRGGNFFMPRIFNRYRAELGVTALPLELESGVQRTLEHLQSSAARLRVDSASAGVGWLAVAVEVESLAGHKLPTAYPSRRVWIHLTVADREGRTLFESGALSPDGSIVGNDNDRDASLFEPHYELIDDPEQVQIFEAILAGPDDAVTTGLLTAVRYVKDNRILPRGFDKETAPDDIAVQGHAKIDEDFIAGSDRVGYRIEVGDSPGPFTVRAELLYQPIAYRWAHNLGDTEAEETARFVSYYEALAEVSAVKLVEVTARTTG